MTNGAEMMPNSALLGRALYARRVAVVALSAAARAAAAAKALAEAGHGVHLLTEPPTTNPAAWLEAALESLRPHIVVAIGLDSLAALPSVGHSFSVVTIIDVAPRLTSDANAVAAQTIAALARADLLLASSQTVRHALLPWLLLAGHDPREPTSALAPATGEPSTAALDWQALLAFCARPWRRHVRHVRTANDRVSVGAEPHGEPLALVDRLETAVARDVGELRSLVGQAQRRARGPWRHLAAAKAHLRAFADLDVNLYLTEHEALLAGELRPGDWHGQTFARGDGWLYRLDLLFATFRRLNGCTVRLHLGGVDTVGRGPDLATVDVPACELQDNRFYAFVFPPLPPAPGQRLAFWIESPDARAGDTVGLWCTLAAPVGAVQRLHRGELQDGALVFRAYERPDPRFSSERLP